MSEKTKNYRISNVYSFGYHKELLSYLTFRAEKSLDFILPLIKRDMVVLECGCGPGVVTFEISKKAKNGFTIGIDIDEEIIISNNQRVSENELTNLKFEVADILELPYPNNYFDVVYMQALIVHMKSPVDAIKEACRVLKKDGLIAIKEPIIDKAIFSPEKHIFVESFKLIEKAIKSYGGDPSIGRKLLPLLQEVGFRNIQISASWEQPDSLEQWPVF